MFYQHVFTSKSWILFIYLLLQSSTSLGQLAAEDAQFIDDFIASSPGFAANFANKNICQLGLQFGCDVNGHLTRMELAISLGGTIPDSIGTLPNIRTVRIQRAALTGTIPPSIVNNLNLTQLDLTQNFLEGPIPAGLFSHPTLTLLFLKSNQLTGTIPGFTTNKLLTLVLSNNFLTGTIPPSLFQQPNFRTIDLSNNELTGTIPEIVNMEVLSDLQLAQNYLTGTIPKSLFNSSSLLKLLLGDNKLTGTLPLEFSTTSLNVISMPNNQLSGTIPNITISVINIELRSNLFVGQFPFINSSLLGSLVFANNRLSGTIPYDSLNCPALVLLDISNNMLSGPLPSFAGARALTLLDLSLNNFSGKLDELSNLPNIFNLYLSSNSFAGEFVPNQAWSSIFEIDVHSNQFEGSFPQFSIYSANSLRNLDFSFNRFNGTLDGNRLSSLTSLQNLNIRGNRLTGTLPELSISAAGALDFSNNNFYGTIPQSIGQLLTLTDLNIANNQFEGTIPDVFATILRLTSINMEFNKLTGTMPPSLGTLRFLTSMVLTSNELNGTIPSYVGSLQSLQTLKLDSNNFEGTIPEEIGNLQSLTQLALENNALTGTIPAGLLNAGTISSLTLQNNQLHGTVPSSLNTIQNLKQLNLANNNFLGFFEPTMPLIECNLGGNNFCCGDLISRACRASPPCSGTRKIVEQNETISSLQQYQSLEVPTGVVMLVDAITSIQTQCLKLNGEVQFLIPNPDFPDASYMPITFSHAFTELPSGSLAVVEGEKCTNFEAQLEVTPATASERGFFTVEQTSSAVEACSDLSEATVFALAFTLGIGLPLIVALIVIIILWRKGRFRRNIRQKVSMDIMTSLADKSFLTPSSSLKLERELGAGSFGKVYIGKWQQTQVAFKFCNVPSKMDEFLREAALMMKLTPHPNVVQLLAISVDGPEPVIVLEYCDGGSLDNVLFDTAEPVSNEEKIRLAAGIARGMLHLHKHNIIHRDLAARNVLIQKGTPKVSDFGMSRLLQVNHESKTYSNIGPIRWMAPESLRDRINSPKSDVWMYGVVLTEIITQTEPHIDEDVLGIGAKIRDQGVTPALPADIHPLLKQLVDMCLKMNAEDRPDFEAICQHIDQYCNANGITV